MKDKKGKKKEKTSSSSKGVTATRQDIAESFSSGRELKRPRPSRASTSENTKDDHKPTRDENKTVKKGGRVNIDGNLQNVREELRNVIELMAPSTPRFILNTSSEEIDDSCISTSYISSLVQVKVTNTDDVMNRSQQYDKLDFIDDTPRDISQISALPSDSVHSDVNVKVHKNVNIESDRTPLTQHLRELDNYKACLEHYKSCPCRQYIKNLQQMASNRGRRVFRKEYTILREESTETRFQKLVRLLDYFKFKRPSKEYTRDGNALDLYTVNILPGEKDTEGSPPRRLVFDKIDDIPKPETTTVATNTNKLKPAPKANVGVTAQMIGVPGVPTPFHTYIPTSKYQQILNCHRSPFSQEKVADTKETQTKQECTKVDIYYFDHGCPAYFKTTDCPPCLITEMIAEKTEVYTARFWAEVFGTVHIGFAFFSSFILQLLRFILQSLIRPIFVGIIQLMSDYCFKPLLTVIFNGVIQPPLIFLYNVFTSLRDLMDPIAEGIGYFIQEIANLFRAIRLVDLKQGVCQSPTERIRRRRCRTSVPTTCV